MKVFIKVEEICYVLSADKLSLIFFSKSRSRNVKIYDHQHGVTANASNRVEANFVYRHVVMKTRTVIKIKTIRETLC